MSMKDIKPSRVTETVVASSRSTIVEQDVEANAEATKSGKEEFRNGEGESALPDDKRQEALERVNHNWQRDPENPRNW